MRKSSVSKKSHTVSMGIVKISCSFNNTIISITDTSGNTIAWSSSGASGFKGSKKSTPYAAQMAAENVAKKAMNDYGLKTVAIEISGPGSGRESAIRAIGSTGLNITFIKDITAIPRNGCRPPKRRRV